MIVKFSCPKSFWPTPLLQKHQGVIFKVQKLYEKLKKIKTALGHLLWDQNELIDKKKPEHTNFVKLSL